MVRAVLHVVRLVFIAMCAAAALLAAAACVVMLAFALALTLAGRSRRSMRPREGSFAR